MKSRRVVYDEQVWLDLREVFLWLSEVASPVAAISINERILEFLGRLDVASERGTLREDVRPGLRIVGYGRATVAFTVHDDEVVILRVFYGGQNWEAAMRSRPPN